MTKDEMAKRAKFTIACLKAARRYEGMTAAVLMAVKHRIITASQTAGDSEEGNSLDRYLKPHQLTAENFFAGMFLTTVIAELEAYLVEVMRVVLLEFPKKMTGASFKLDEVIDKSIDELITLAAEERLMKLMYKKPSEYLAELADVLSVDTASLTLKWPVFVEAKARRDLGVHNSWKVNTTYIRKTGEVGLPSPPSGSSLAADYVYVRGVIDGCDAVARGIRSKLEDKYPMPLEGS